MQTFKYKDKVFKVVDSPKKDKDKRAIFPDGTKIDFGAKDYPEYPSTKRGDNYCTRSKGLGNTDKVKSANFLSRKVLWKCKGEKSMDTYKDAGLNLVKKEEFFDKL